MANTHVRQVEEDIVVELELRFEAFMSYMKGVDMTGRCRQVHPSESSSNRAHSSSKAQFKPLEACFDKSGKNFSRFTSTTTIMSTEDTKAIHDFFMSGRAFSDMRIPRMFLKKLCDSNIL